MKFVVISRNVPGAERSQAAGDEEYPRVDRLHAAGFFEQIYLRGDAAGAIAVVEAESEERVRATLAELPFFAAGLVEVVELLAVTPRW